MADAFAPAKSIREVPPRGRKGRNTERVAGEECQALKDQGSGDDPVIGRCSAASKNHMRNDLLKHQTHCREGSHALTACLMPVGP